MNAFFSRVIYMKTERLLCIKSTQALQLKKGKKSGGGVGRKIWTTSMIRDENANEVAKYCFVALFLDAKTAPVHADSSPFYRICAASAAVSRLLLHHLQSGILHTWFSYLARNLFIRLSPSLTYFKSFISPHFPVACPPPPSPSPRKLDNE